MVETATLASPLPDASTVPLSPEGVTTYYAPAGRDAPAEFHRKAAVIEEAPLLVQAFDAMPTMVAILNAHRQIVWANRVLLDVLGSTICRVAGKRPGEAIGCMYAKQGPDGCGTARYCVTCGAVHAILESQQQQARVVRECSITVETSTGPSPMDLEVTAAPFRVGEERFIVASIEDISQPRRLAVLQRTFFHDVLNTAGCVQGYAQYLSESGFEDRAVCERIAHLAGQLIESIQAQRDLTRAEAGDLKLHPETLDVPTALEELRLQYGKHSVAEGRAIRLGEVWQGSLATDRQLFYRVLGNMLKNALEATGPNGTVTIGCREMEQQIIFSVHNPEVMPETAQLQIFKRSFSTKGESGRGVGTYSMKLFGERYLHGKVGFVSQSPEGTTFTLTIPKELAADRNPEVRSLRG